MKKILLFFTAIGFAIGMTACQETEPVVEDSAVQTLQEAYDSLNALITDPSNITGGFSVPTALKGGEVTAEWSSTNPGVLTVGEESEGLATVTVNRPAFGDPDAEVTLKAMLSIPSALDAEQVLQLEWTIELTIKANTVEEVSIENIADVLAVTEVEYDGTYQVTLSGLTIVAKGNQSAFAYDGTGIIQVYGGDMALLEVGNVYTMSATIEWYYGVWELTDWTATEEPESDPKMPEPEEVTDLQSYLDAMIASGENLYADGNAASGAFHVRHLKVTGKVYVIPGDTSNYNTYIVPSDYDTTQAWVSGTDENPAKGLMLYYDSKDMDAVRAYDGLLVTIEVLLYTYRSNNDAFAIYYIGGPNGIEATLTDGEKLSIDANSLSLPSSILEPTTLVLPSSGDNGTIITWVSSDETIINSSTGEVTMPPTGLATVTLTATLEIGTETPVTKVFTIVVGDQSSIKAALDAEEGTEATVVGKVNAIIDNKTFSITDGEYAIYIYDGAGTYTSSAETPVAIGDVVEVVGERSQYNGLIQVKFPTSLTVLTTQTFEDLPVLDGNTMDLSGDLSHLQGHYFTFTGVPMSVVSNPSWDNLQFTITVGGQTFTVFYDSRLSDEELEAFLYDYSGDGASKISEGTLVNLRVVLGWSSGPQFRLQQASDIRDANDLPTSIELALDAEEGTEATVVGKVNAIIDNKTFSITDGEYAIYIYDGAGTYTSSAETPVAIGDVVEVVGERSQYNGLIQVKFPTSLTVLTTQTFEDLPVLDGNTMDLSGDLSHLQGHYFTFTGVPMSVVSNPSWDNLQFTITVGGQTFTVFYDSRLSDEELEAFLYDYSGDGASKISEGTLVNLRVVLGWSSGPQFRLQQASDVQIPEPATPDVFISEYIEGTSNNKALELYNPTSEAIDLTGYMINYYNNGGTDATPDKKKSYDLSGIVLPAGGTYTIVTDSFAGTGTYDEVQAWADSDSVVFFNGDDTITLTKNGEIIDIIGVLGEDPWTLDGVAVAWAEHTYVRKSGTTSGSTVWDPTEWDEYDQNDFSHLGSHTA